MMIWERVWFLWGAIESFLYSIAFFVFAAFFSSVGYFNMSIFASVMCVLYSIVMTCHIIIKTRKMFSKPKFKDVFNEFLDEQIKLDIEVQKDLNKNHWDLYE